MKFSEKQGFKRAREAIQVDSMSTELRISLWNLLKIFLWDKVYYIQGYGGRFLTQDGNPEMRTLVHMLWFHHFKLPLDTLDLRWETVLEYLRKHFFGCQWYEVYDFVEFVAREYPYNDAKGFIDACNSTLESGMSGYRFVGTEVAPITDKQEITEVDTALDASSRPVGAHLNRALELLSDRSAPDYRNSIKESVSAVESLVATTLGENGTLGQLIKKLEDEIGLHPALAKAFHALYGYASDKGGVRHALLGPANVTFEDAKFFLVLCSAFVNFVRARALSPLSAAGGRN